jgi:SAM-dependent methyltransferase
MTETQHQLEVPKILRRGAKKGDDLYYIESGRDLLGYMTNCLGLDDLSQSTVLDMGCGTKFTQAILEYDIAIKQYVGIDVYRDMIEHLRSEVSDPRFEYHHMNTHNEMYNPNGDALSASTSLPVEESAFDIICLFSVFTHLAPHDYASMLRMLRAYIKDTGKLIFSLYIDERSHNGHGLIEQIAIKEGGDWQSSGKPFVDAYPDKPLQWALYSRQHSLELIEGSGWQVDELLLPNKDVQFHYVCSPA